MTIGRKIVLGYGLVLVFLAVVVATGLYAIVNVQNAYAGFIDIRQRLIDNANELRFETRDQIAHYRGFLLYPDEQETYWNQLQEDHRQFNDMVERMRKLVPAETGLKAVEEIAELQGKHEREQEKVVALIRQGKRTEGLALGATAVRPLTQEIIEKVEAFRKRQAELVTQGRAEIEATTNHISTVLITLSLLAFGTAIGVAFLLTRVIGRQLRESISQLSTSSAEILATTTQVAAGAAETATAVNETTTTVEEVKQTAQVSAQKAKYVSETAQKTSQVSQKGKGAVAEAVLGMKRIREQMEAVAESIVRLSEQGQSIGEIISAVNDLADQSNLLAVNAAIEAAKAGEYGRGFVVVAQEVRNLSEQSKQATAQVRAILSDVQKATSAAVMATEQGTKVIESGATLWTDAGEAIRSLAESIAESAQAATQIAASSQQQLVGMDQIALAMENVKQATTQNVAGTKQAEQAAQALGALGERLRSMIESNRVAA